MLRFSSYSDRLPSQLSTGDEPVEPRKSPGISGGGVRVSTRNCCLGVAMSMFLFGDTVKLPSHDDKEPILPTCRDNVTNGRPASWTSWWFQSVTTLGVTELLTVVTSETLLFSVFCFRMFRFLRMRPLED